MERNAEQTEVGTIVTEFKQRLFNFFFSIIVIEVKYFCLRKKFFECACFTCKVVSKELNTFTRFSMCDVSGGCDWNIMAYLTFRLLPS